MGIDQIAPEALKLSPRERAFLAASLWESVEDPFDLSVTSNDEEAIALAIARDAELDSGTVAPVAHADLMRQVRR